MFTHSQAESKENSPEREKKIFVYHLNWCAENFSNRIKNKPTSTFSWCNIFEKSKSQLIKDLNVFNSIVESCANNPQIPAIVLAFKVLTYLEERECLFKGSAFLTLVKKTLDKLDPIITIFCEMMSMQKIISETGEASNFHLKCQVSFIKKDLFTHETYGKTYIESYIKYRKEFNDYNKLPNKIEDNKFQELSNIRDRILPVRNWY